MAATLALGFTSVAPSKSKHADVVVYMTSDGPTTTSQAKSLATSMFAAAGVRVAWRNGEPEAPAPGVVTLTIRLVRSPRQCYTPDALACAYPYARADRAIVVFEEQLRVDAGSTATPQYILLAHVLVHEMTHVLEGVDRHSEAGIMKARYTKRDKYAMMSGPLPFDPLDVKLIHAGLALLRGRAEISRSGAAARIGDVQ
jgi:hypothetical protein